ncbi:MAG: hypothetical protein HWN80_19050 [Candidatus Lokiarchaeota archaeon]|nr:hypothetical protein [Candidatus Lokiarchaeota archaeon]
MSNSKNLKRFYSNHRKFIFKLEDVNNKNNIGNKAFNLKFLKKKGFHIPKSYVCDFAAFELYKQGNNQILSDLKQELEYYIDENLSYSIRSSANLEDVSAKSFAGQFQTVLNQNGVNNIVESIVEIWNSSAGDKPQAYNKQFSQNTDQIKMGVIIQEMIYPEFSGVVFTRNPLTGLNEIIVESVEGLGDNLVQAGITPERWVYKWGDWIESPKVDESKLKIISKIVSESIKIAKIYGEPVDLEWTYDAKDIYWLQLREITTLRNNKLYSNKLSREFLPGMIKPLIWSVNIPVVNTSWKHIFEELIGSPAKNIDINNLAHPFYYRAYFNMKIMGDIFELLGMPRDLLETLAGIDSEGKDKPSFKPSGRTMYFLPRILLFCLKLNSFSKYIGKFLKSHKKEYDLVNKIDVDILSEEICVEFIHKLFELNTQASYFVIITQLLNSFYSKLVKSKLNKNNIEFGDTGLTLINKRLESTDPRSQISKLNNEFKNLKISEKEDINKIEYEVFLKRYADYKFTRDFKKFILKFGFLRDSGNDFSQPSWSETPQLMLKMVIDYKGPKLKRAYEERFRIVKKYLFKSSYSKMILKRAIKYLDYRQTVTNLYSYGYGLFRMFFLRISDLFVKKGLIKDRDDIFYMTFDEVKKVIENNEEALNVRNRLSKRKIEMIAYRDLQLPEIIYGEVLPKPIDNAKIVNELQGVPTSKGFYIGPVKVVKGIMDMKKIKDGDIIAIPYSDVSWTPLFAKAKAVISESGGILSHCSIVAREYNIPAIVSVIGATFLKDNTLIAVDAFKGKISILKKTYKLEEKEDEIELSTFI